MAVRSRTTFKKRQKELERQEKQRAKSERRQQRKTEKDDGDDPFAIAEDEDLVVEHLDVPLPFLDDLDDDDDD